MLLQIGPLFRLGPNVITDGTFITLGSSYYTCAEGCNPFTLVHLPNFSYHLTPTATIDDQIVDTVSLNGVSFGEQNNPH